MPKVEDLKFNEDICAKFCGTCPTYPGSNPSKLGELLYCGKGKSKKFPNIEKKGCNCPGCDVRLHYECPGDYYCMTGPC